MASLSRLFSAFGFFPLLFLSSGCAEIRAFFTVMTSKSTALSVSGFEFDEIRSGSRVTCAGFVDRSMRCLGSGDNGNLGTFNSGPAEIEGPIRMVAAGKEFTCVVSGKNSGVSCFGNNRFGQLGTDSVFSRIKAKPVMDLERNGAVLEGVRQISAGDHHACALLNSGRAVCWGDNAFGQLGNDSGEGAGARSVLESTRNRRPIPAVKSIVAGANSTCMILGDESSVFCFGERFGLNKKMNWVPERVEYENNSGTLSDVKELGVGRGFGCALTRSARVVCWGRNDFNQLGLSNKSPGLARAMEVEVSHPAPGPLSKIIQISVGDAHACALSRESRSVYCWGKNEHYQLGNGSNRGIPEQVAVGANNISLKDVKEVSAGYDRTCIISLRNEAFCWGNGMHGLLGNSAISSTFPIHVLDSNSESLTGVLQITVGFDHTCMIDQRNQLYCFGINSSGQMGSERIAGRVLSQDGVPVEKVISFDSDGSRTCLVYGESQELACFGGRDTEYLKLNPARNSFSLEPMIKNGKPLRGVQAVALGPTETCVIDDDQSVVCFPRGNVPSIPVTIAGVSGPIRDAWQVRIRGKQGCALIQETGSIYCWDLGSLSQTSIAEQVTVSGGNATNFIQLALSGDSLCGIRGSERALYCGKFTGPGKIDLQPVADHSGTGVHRLLMVSGGGAHFCAIREPGKLLCWGSNSTGQLGIKGMKDSAIPLPVEFTDPRLKDIVRVSCGEAHTCVATANDPSLFCFGESFFGGSQSPNPLEYPL